MHTVDNEASSYTSPILGSLSLSALYLLLVFGQRKVEILIQMMMALGSLITSHFLPAIDLLLATNIVVDLAAQVDGSSTVIARGRPFPSITIARLVPELALLDMNILPYGRSTGYIKEMKHGIYQPTKQE